MMRKMLEVQTKTASSEAGGAVTGLGSGGNPNPIRRGEDQEMAHDSGEQCPAGLNECSNGDLEQVAICFPDEWIPKVDMEFETEQEAYDFYNRYAFEMGFSIRRSSRHLLRKGGEVKDRTFCCSREGIRGKDRRKETVQTPRYETRCNCNAKLKISLRNGKYYVFQFIPEHNHELATRTQVHRLRSHRHIIPAQPVTTLGISPKPTFDLMSAEVDGHENLGFILNFGNDLRAEQSLTVKIGDSGGVLEYLEKMQLEDPKFFYSVQLDKLHTATNIFWADSRMIADYKNFGDVVCIDTTCKRLNVDNRLFGLLVGVNNHKQLIVFGAFLLDDETSESFKWMFSTFLKAMLGNKPKTVLTDDNIAMAKAIKMCMPEVNHRICVWQIGQNICQQLSEVVRDYKNFCIDFCSCLYDHDEEATFIDSWNAMLVKYKLVGNACLDRLFEKKEQWALVYDRNVFYAGIYNAQRNDNMMAAKAAETEETYAIAAGQINKLLQEVEKRLRKRYKPDPEGEHTELNVLEVELGQTMEGDVSSREQMHAQKLKGMKHTANKKKKKIRPQQISVGTAEQNLSAIHLNNDVYNPTSDTVQRNPSSSMGREAPQDNFARQHPVTANANLWLDLSQPPTVGAHTSLIADSFQLQANSFSPGIYQIHNPTSSIPINQQGHLNMLQQFEPQIHSLSRQLFSGSAEG
ncbi:hypothetical protein M5K25_006261 [Dendrobium thyrsiflorum]|uniref:Protein FAR1-RELATED SEQUENCE n=1 Tax=Dendrobium thyrsiflorum TaxID=117978 RepID=A0ABD0VID0_DENTH